MTALLPLRARHLLIAAALAMRPGRKVVLSEPGNFPTDLYMIAGLEAQGLAERRLAERLPACRRTGRPTGPRRRGRPARRCSGTCDGPERGSGRRA